MKHIYLVRHGETDYNKSHRMQGRGINASLNGIGRVQAVRIAEFLKDRSITKVITSSLNRAKESAEPICKHFVLTPESYAELDEMDFGTLEGKLIEEVKEDLKVLHNSWAGGSLKISPEKGESPIEVFERSNSKIDEVLTLSEDEHIVFMLHGRLIRILLSEWLGLGLQNMHKIDHQNGAINHLKWNSGVFEAIELNVVSHLDF